jgi:hypothetical protein
MFNFNKLRYYINKINYFFYHKTQLMRFIFLIMIYIISNFLFNDGLIILAEEHPTNVLMSKIKFDYKKSELERHPLDVFMEDLSLKTLSTIYSTRPSPDVDSWLPKYIIDSLKMQNAISLIKTNEFPNMDQIYRAFRPEMFILRELTDNEIFLHLPIQSPYDTQQAKFIHNVMDFAPNHWIYEDIRYGEHFLDLLYLVAKNDPNPVFKYAYAEIFTKINNYYSGINQDPEFYNRTNYNSAFASVN